MRSLCLDSGRSQAHARVVQFSGLAPQNPASYTGEDPGQWCDHETRPQAEAGAYIREYFDATEVLKSPAKPTKTTTHQVIGDRKSVV